MCMQIVCAPSLAVLSGILQVCARGVCVRCAVIESSTLLLLCFYFASTLLNLIPNLIPRGFVVVVVGGGGLLSWWSRPNNTE